MTARPTTSSKAGIFLSCVDEEYYSNELLVQRNTLLRMISGEMKIILPDRTIMLVPGDTVLFPANLLSRVVKYPKGGLPYKSAAIYFTEECLFKYYQNAAVPVNPEQPEPDICTFAPHYLLDSLFNSLLPYFESATVLPDDIAAIKINEAISILRTVNPKVDQTLSNFSTPQKVDLVKFMEKNYRFNLSLNRFSYLTGRSLSSFKRDFKKAFQLPPQKWLTQKRLELAYHQISVLGKKPIEVCYEAGFENLSHFSYAFKKQFKISPSTLCSRNNVGFSEPARA